jgi:hypothetical protein
VLEFFAALVAYPKTAFLCAIFLLCVLEYVAQILKR